LLGHLDLKREFRDFALRPEGSGVWLDASAKNAEAPYGKIQMLVSGQGEISRLTVIGRDESRLEFELSHEQVNPAVNDGMFAFKIPAGAEVVDAIEYAGEGK
jgi:outer membrane lipoprotein-sorting protein